MNKAIDSNRMKRVCNILSKGSIQDNIEEEINSSLGKINLNF